VLLGLLSRTAVILGGAVAMDLVLIATRKVPVFAGAPLLGMGLIPALVAMTPYLGWVAWHRDRLGLGDGGTVEMGNS